MTPAQIKTTVDLLGVAIVPNILSSFEIETLLQVLGETDAGDRGVLVIPEIAQLARSPRLLELARPHLTGEPRPVRGIYFDKTAASNWLVPWHQDLTLAVRKQVNFDGFGAWSVRDGVPHVQAPAKLLEQMITIRLHLDDSDESNGALRVLMGSHRFGRVPGDQIRGLSKECPELVCRVNAGHALLMRPLLLHCSSRSNDNRHRRVLAIEYAGFDLPQPLQWHEA